MIGVVGDVRNNGLDNPTVPEVYLLATIASMNSMRFIVRSTLPETALVPQVRRAIRNLNPGQPVYHVSTMSRIVEESVALKRMSSLL